MSLTPHSYALGAVAGGNHRSAQNDEREPDDFTSAEKIRASDVLAVELQRRDPHLIAEQRRTMGSEQQ
jgi:hypothetical protein